ncbi:MAG: UDP-N-acetylmuramoyl-L-alanine--D-glutamate ligase [Bacteroidales bacterium]|jgi:UDP-N-acetylmuramoylalanine--D-glutamate ligase|nr:UDP-N-acetylmuramoyl-L-alanine--D-glutamate ligase [Bacteroidales bacterium]MDD4213668.1 UDP-N-acetylmuramoyl-L-alanine--D-glutamate ligase [Bacteroidales bacterium]
MLNHLKTYFKGKKILILGFGIEGKSTFRLIRMLFPEMKICIADEKACIEHFEILKNDKNIQLQTGNNYLEGLSDFDIIIKTPGISPEKIGITDFSKFTSHTELFFRFFRNQIIGITGTKGKSTTSSLIHHIISSWSPNCQLAGNIGIPPFDLIDKINKDTLIVYELSSHQLEQTRISPKTAVFLNLYEEHLDHYKSFDTYQQAKFSITRFQEEADNLIYNADDERIVELLYKAGIKRNFWRYSLKNEVTKGCYLKEKTLIFKAAEKEIQTYKTGFNNLPGVHNLQNIMAAICAGYIAEIPAEKMINAIKAFKPLEHRMEYAGTFNDIIFYNDSIATIPEAAVAAISTLKNVNTLILGGYDRGVSYDPFVDYLEKTNIENVILIDTAGKRLHEIFQKKNYHSKKIFYFDDFENAVITAKKVTTPHKICLLSPAAASYGMFKNFEERGTLFKKLIRL